MPPKVTHENTAQFKSRAVGKHSHKEVEKEIEQLPDDLKQLWNERNFKTFLEKALKKLEDGGYEKEEKLSDSLLDILPSLASSDDKEVHELIQKFYCTYTHEDVGNFTDSRYEYILNMGITETSKKLLSSDWIDEVFTKELNERLLRKERNLDTKRLTQAKENLIAFPMANAAVRAALTLNVEATFANKCRETPAPPEGSILLDIAAKFVNTSCEAKRFFKLDSKFPKCPGVYFLYYIGERELYKKSQIYGSLFFKEPVYVGMSTTDISGRLADHRRKIVAAIDLNVADFAVNVMFVDNKHYAPCIEGMLIKHFNPIWNKETMGLCFGTGKNSLWKKIHIDQDGDSINELLDRLEIANSSDDDDDDDDDASSAAGGGDDDDGGDNDLYQ